MTHMRALRLVALAAIAIPFAAGVYACGSDTLQNGSMTGDGGVPLPDATTDVATDTSGGGADTGTDTGGGGNDAGADTAVPVDSNAPDSPAFDGSSTPDGGAASDPGHIACVDAAPCSVPAEQCCVGSNGTGSCKASCPGGSIVVLKCDEAANCADGGVCCASESLTAPNASGACAASCSLGQVQLCRTNGECPNHDCTPQTCTFGSTKVRIEACGSVLGCTSP
jgi:hypothetical protein